MIYIIGTILGFIIFIYLYLTWNHNYWDSRNVPFEKPGVLFGNMKDVFNGSKHFGVHYVDMYRKFKNLPYFGYFKLRDPAIMLRDPELIKTILVKDYISFAINDFQVDPSAEPIFSMNIFTQNGDTWKRNRGAWSSAITTSKIKLMFDSLNTKCENMTNYLKNHIKNKPNQAIETRDLSTKYFIDAILSTIVGTDFNSFDAKENSYKKITQSIFESSFSTGIITAFVLFVPTIAKLLKLRFLPKETEDLLIMHAKDILKTRQKNGYQKNNPFDILLTHYNSIGKGVTELETAGILFNFLLDGTETSAGVLAYLLYEIAKNPNIQSKLRTEIDDAFIAEGGKLSHEKIHSLQYLDQVIMETMRLYPPAMSMQRLCTKPYNLSPINNNDKPIKIPVGMPVIIPIYALHLDPEYYPEPEMFNPDRFSQENKNSIPKFAYLPFGEGPRLCVGSRLALNQTKIGIVHLLRNFEFRLAAKMQGKKLEIDPKIFIMKAVGDLWINVHERIDVIKS